MAQRANGRRSVPQIFINGQHQVDVMIDWNKLGQLDSLLAQSAD